ncbi:MAG: CobN component of cobalt chelatase involved in biosynthesis, partial [Proteobacteria bacterium]|nr:CobN component of cobalt chelatase involved in biosynthesis [Pseudomonadota bacterium]
MHLWRKLLGFGLVLFGLILLLAGAEPASAATPRVAYLTAAPAPAGKSEVLTRAAQAQGFELEARYVEKLDEAGLAHFAGNADLLIVDTPRPGLLEFMLGKLGPAWSARTAPRLLLDGERVEARGLDHALATELQRYLNNGGRRNLDAATQLIAARIFKLRSAEGIPALQTMPTAAYYHPRLADTVTTQADAALAVSGQPGQAVIGVAIHQTYVSGVDTAYVDALIAEIEAQGGRALVFYTPMMEADQFLKMAAPGGRRLADVLINNQIM